MLLNVIFSYDDDDDDDDDDDECITRRRDVCYNDLWVSLFQVFLRPLVLRFG